MCHPREGGDPESCLENWIPAFAGMTQEIKFFMNIFKNTLLFLLLLITSCSSGTTTLFSDPTQVGVDSTNDRVFVIQGDRQVFAFTASTLAEIGDQPVVDETDNETVFDLMPTVTTYFAVYSTSTSSRLFVLGSLTDDSGNVVLNRIRVLDFDGTTFTEASFSPIILSDGDDATTDSDNSFTGMVLDQANSVLYVSDASAAVVHAISAVDGTEVTTPIAIAGVPQGMSLADSHLYVCNDSTEETEQLITAIDVSDFSTTTIDLDIPCSQVAAQSNGTSVILLVRNADTQSLLIQTVDTTTFASASDIASADTATYANGSLSSGAGISSSIEGIVTTSDSSGNFYVYLSEIDGNIQYITIPSSLSSYTLETLSTSAINLGRGAVLEDTSGNGVSAFVVSEAGALLDIEVGTTNVDVND
jgi:hypothetical protein